MKIYKNGWERERLININYGFLSCSFNFFLNLFKEKYTCPKIK